MYAKSARKVSNSAPLSSGLGVGLVYWSALSPLVESPDTAISVVELEPQTLWEQVQVDAGWRYRANEALFETVAALPQAKLLHGVGHPLGGTAPDPIDPMPLLRDAVDRLNPAWVSEHMSFNRVRRADGTEHAGFLLPPPQSHAAVRVAAHNIREFVRAIDRPLAFETGVNYLRPIDGEMSDGDFFAEVAEWSNSGIVLDLHNLWCNERNGRARVADVLARIPLERVWEIHLAGGLPESGYWLDAHSGAVPDEVMQIAADLIPRLPKLGALIFEILPEHLPQIGLDGVQRQIEALHQLWRLRNPQMVRTRAAARNYETAPATVADFAEVARWETGLVDALREAPGSIAVSHEVRADPGCALLRGLVADFRCASLARSMRYTVTSLLAGIGPRETRSLLDGYFREQTPEPFTAVEADRFARFLRGRLTRLPPIPYLDQVLSFEHALVTATIYGVTSDIVWSADPVLVLESLDAGRLPAMLVRATHTMRICADSA